MTTTNKVTPDQILDLDAYEQRRGVIQQRILFEKKLRRIHVGDALTFLFENAETVRYQVQEMLRIERITAPEGVQHEIDTYNELIGGPGELGCTLLIEIDDERERDRLLREWLELPQHLYAELEDGTKVRPVFDARQVGETRVSSVHYLTFPLGDAPPVALGADLPALTVRAELDAAQRGALAADLAAASA